MGKKPDRQQRLGVAGNGDGTFQTAVNYTAGRNSVFVVVDDFNRDGRPDLAVANAGTDANALIYPVSTGSGISVLLGKGDGTFQAAVNYEGGNSARSVAVGDFNRDGNLDLAVIHHNWVSLSGSHVSILLGKGDGTFETGADYLPGGDALSIVAGDFNGDGISDLATAGPEEPTGSISLLLGNGDGTFRAALNYLVDARFASSLIMGDFNGDGKPDLATSGWKYADPPSFGWVGTVSVFLGKGDGTFRTVVNHVAGPYGFTAGDLKAVGDFNGDGLADLASSTALLLGQGDGTFRPITITPLPNSGILAVGDFDGDRRPDLVVSDPASSGLSVLLNTGASASPTTTFASIGEFGTGGEDAVAGVVVGDFNGDGKTDLAVANRIHDWMITPSFWTDGDISVLLGKGDGTFGSPVNQIAGAAFSLLTGDFNGDGKLDLLVGSYGPYDRTAQSYTNSNISVFLGQGDGTFQTAANLRVLETSLRARDSRILAASMAVHDFNSDGKLDVAVLLNDDVAILLGKGDGGFQAAVRYDAGRDIFSVAAGDFNGDGKSDLVVHSNDGAEILWGKGDGTFQPSNKHEPIFYSGLVAVGDFNGDGKSDLAVGSEAEDSENFTHNVVSVLLGNGDGTFQAVNYDVTLFPYELAVADFNGDSKPDLIAVSNFPAVLLGRGDGTFQLAASYFGRLTYSFALGDFNGDTQLDFLIAGNPNDSGDVAKVWLNTSCSAGASLAIAHSGATLTLSWPFPSAGYVLESSTSLNPATWKPVDTVPVHNDGRWQITMSAAQSQGYFRLRKP